MSTSCTSRDAILTCAHCLLNTLVNTWLRLLRRFFTQQQYDPSHEISNKSDQTQSYPVQCITEVWMHYGMMNSTLGIVEMHFKTRLFTNVCLCMCSITLDDHIVDYSRYSYLYYLYNYSSVSWPEAIMWEFRGSRLHSIHIRLLPRNGHSFFLCKLVWIILGLRWPVVAQSRVLDRRNVCSLTTAPVLRVQNHDKFKIMVPCVPCTSKYTNTNSIKNFGVV